MAFQAMARSADAEIPRRRPCGKGESLRASATAGVSIRQGKVHGLEAHATTLRTPFGLRSIFLAALLSALALPTAASDDPASEAFFERKIRPVLATHCYECHSLEAGESKGGLRLDSREALLLGGDTGPGLSPGAPGESLLLLAMRHEEPDLEMPPKKERLPDAVLADFERWILAGAQDPRDEASLAGAGAASQYQEDLAARLEHWAYSPPAAPELPELRDDSWPLRELDRFVLAQLEDAGLEPSPPASETVFLRRLHFDLTGLPPSPEEVEVFSWDQLEETVDALLHSDGFGVRWGRHWLDVARFAESNGKESNLAYPHAWRYRDYVIDAINAGVPYDRFILEQIAGDLLPADDEAERARLHIATGFLAVGAKTLGEQNAFQFLADLIDEQIDAASRSFTATSLACARCHDHKTEPYSMVDYYAAAGIFLSTDTRYGTWIDSENNNGGELIRLPDLPGQLVPNRPGTPEEVAKLKADLEELNREDREQKAYIEKARAEGRDLREEFNDLLRNVLRIYWRRGGVEGRLATLDDEGRPLPLAMGVLERDEPRDAPLLRRGDLNDALDPVPRALPASLQHPGSPEIPADSSGRLQLAQWIAHPEHPLTARVLVNRVWHHLFGTGIVRTVDDFSATGAPPSHPELLDLLALRFVESGWSLREAVREVVLSQAYRQDSAHRPEAFALDPDNRLLWRMAPSRLEAEAIRDAMLAVSGEIDLSPRPGSLVAALHGQSISLVGFNDKLPRDLDGTRHRAVYLPVLREHLPDVLETFDFAEPSLVTGARDTTNVPMQALYLMNSDFVNERAAALAARVASAAGEDPAARVVEAFRRVHARQPDETERALALGFLEAGEEESGGPSRLERLCHALISSAEFVMRY